MGYRKRFNYIFVLFLIFAGLPIHCYGDSSCGFSTECPYTRPPCYKVKIKGVHGCYLKNGTCFDDGSIQNSDWSLGYCSGSSCDECVWQTSDGYSVFVKHPPGEGTCVMYYLYLDTSTDTFTPEGSGGNSISMLGCCGPGEPLLGWGGTATWEPVWDCHACSGGSHCAEDMTIYVEKSNKPYYYPNLNCCPVPSPQTYYVRIGCPDADYVIPQCNSNNIKLATVAPDIEGCHMGSDVLFTITTHPGRPPAKVTVTCTASFFDEYGETNSKTTTINIGPSCGPCCDPAAPCPVSLGTVP